MSARKKWFIAFIIFMLLFGIAYAYDFNKANQVKFNIVATPDEAPADGTTVVTIEVKVTDKQGIRVGDNVTIKTVVGNTDVYRAKTDYRGIAVFHYFVPKSSTYKKAEDVIMEFKDESISKWIEVNPKSSIAYHLYEPKADETGEHQNVYDDIFK